MLISHGSGRTRRRFLIAAAGLAAAAALAPPAAADPFAYTLQANHLKRIDLATLELEEVGPTGEIYTRWIAFHADGTLYGLDQLAAGALRLVSYDPATGAGTELAPVDIGDVIFGIRGFAGDACGNLWAVGVYLDGAGEEVPALLPIDPVAGTGGPPVDIVPLDPSIGTHVYGLAPYGNLLLAIGGGGTHAIDPATGEAWALYPDGPLTLNGLDVGPDGGLWALHVIPVAGGLSLVSRLDLVTGEVTDHGHSFGITGLAFGPPGGSCGGAGPVAIPTLSPLSLLALAGALGAVGLRLARRGARA